MFLAYVAGHEAIGTFFIDPLTSIGKVTELMLRPLGEIESCGERAVFETGHYGGFGVPIVEFTHKIYRFGAGSLSLRQGELYFADRFGF